MSLAPPGAKRTRAAFTLLEVLVVVTLIALLAGLGLGVGRRASEAGKTARTRAELVALSAALESYKRAFGDYPRTDDGALLLQSLIGRRGPAGTAVTGRAFLELARFVTEAGRDPFLYADAWLVDPWGQPYRYAYKSTTPWTNPGYVLYSAGPDGIDFSRLSAGGFPDASKTENSDNLHASQR